MGLSFWQGGAWFEITNTGITPILAAAGDPRKLRKLRAERAP
jgi:hypothetical protein